MSTLGVVMPGMFAGLFLTLTGILCFVFNRKVGGWLRKFPLMAFGARAEAEVDEMIFRGLACLAGLLCAGIGLGMLAASLR